MEGEALPRHGVAPISKRSGAKTGEPRQRGCACLAGVRIPALREDLSLRARLDIPRRSGKVTRISEESPEDICSSWNDHRLSLRDEP